MSAYTVSRSSVFGAASEVEILAMPERLDSSTAPLFEKQIFEHITNGTHDLVLNFQDVRFLTAAGLRMILASLRAIKAVEGHFAVCSLHGQAKAMFEACGFDSLITVHKGQDDALTSLAAA